MEQDAKGEGYLKSSHEMAELVLPSLPFGEIIEPGLVFTLAGNDG